METLRTLEPFLTAPFLNLKRNERSLHAFDGYWKTIRDHVDSIIKAQDHHHHQDHDCLPEGIERAIGIYHYIFRSDIPSFFSADSSSPTVSQQSMVSPARTSQL